MTEPPKSSGVLVGYARVSSNDQRLDIQLQQLEAAGCRPIFSEKTTGTNAKTHTRPELDRCLQYIREGDTLVVTRMDRLARSTADFFKILGQLNEVGATFKCLLQPEMDTTTSNGRLVAGLLAIIAQFETEVRRERQKEGINRAKELGVYTRYAVRNGKMSAAAKMLHRGISYREASERTGVPANTLRYKFPGFQTKSAYKGSYRAKMAAEAADPTSPSAAEAVDVQPILETEAPRVASKAGLFGKFRRL